MSPGDVLQQLSVSAEEGLSSSEAKQRQEEYGPNRLREVRRRSAWLILAHQFQGLIVALLAGAAALSFVFGEWLQAGAIAMVLLINAAIGLTGEGGIAIGPHRVVPLSYLAQQSASVCGELEQALRGADQDAPTLDSLDFFTLVQGDHRQRLDAREADILDALADGPKSRLDLARRLDYMAPSLLRVERLEQLGYVRRSALTPTDVLHCTGEFVGWDRRAAVAALEIFARLLRLTSAQAAERIRREVVRRLAMEVMRRIVSLSADSHSLDACAVCRLYLDNLFQGRRREEFAFHFNVTRPIVAIGAPAGVYMPEVGRLLSARVVVPEHADVANAIGAITSKIIVSETATIQPGESGDYIVHTSVERREFEDLPSARTCAERIVADLVRRKAPLYGTNESDIRLEVLERTGTLATGEAVFLEMNVAGTIAGKPVV